MRKILFFIIALFSVASQAQDAKSILDKAADSFKKSGKVEIGFSFTTGQNSSTGKINIDGKKFFADLGGSKTWYNGTTMWHFVQSTKECTITNPTGSEAARLNPYSFITIYKNGYTCKMGKSTKAYFEVVMEGGKKSTYKNITVRLDKANYKPLYIKTQTAKSTLEIQVNSYRKNVTLEDDTFVFNKKEFPGVEVVDLR